MRNTYLESAAIRVRALPSLSASHEPSPNVPVIDRRGTVNRGKVHPGVERTPLAGRHHDAMAVGTAAQGDEEEDAGCAGGEENSRRAGALRASRHGRTRERWRRPDVVADQPAPPARPMASTSRRASCRRACPQWRRARRRRGSGPRQVPHTELVFYDQRWQVDGSTERDPLGAPAGVRCLAHATILGSARLASLTTRRFALLEDGVRLGEWTARRVTKSALIDKKLVAPWQRNVDCVEQRGAHHRRVPQRGCWKWSNACCTSASG